MSGANFQILRVVTLSQFTFHVKDALRIVSIAQGKLEVTMCGKVFNIQEGGMWRLRAGEACSVKNQGENQALLHVSTILPL